MLSTNISSCSSKGPDSCNNFSTNCFRKSTRTLREDAERWQRRSECTAKIRRLGASRPTQSSQGSLSERNMEYIPNESRSYSYIFGTLKKNPNPWFAAFCQKDCIDSPAVSRSFCGCPCWEPWLYQSSQSTPSKILHVLLPRRDGLEALQDLGWMNLRNCV